MARLEWENEATFVVKTAKALAFHVPVAREMAAAFSSFQRTINYANFECRAIAPIDGQPAFSYSFVHRDGRQWTQTLIIDNPNDPLMVFDFTSQWRLSEFVSHRRVRDLCAILIRDYGWTELTVTRP